MEKKYTCIHTSKYLNSGKPTPIIRLCEENGDRYYQEDRNYSDLWFDDRPIKLMVPPLCYIVGEAATRLHEYEQLGYSPLELKNMIQKFETQKKVLNSLYGKPEYLKANLSKIASAIADSVMKDDRQVTIMFDDSGKPVISICPYSEEVEK